MTHAAAFIGELPVAGLLGRKVLPVVRSLAECQAQHAVGRVVPHYTVGLNRAVCGLVVIPATAHDELADAQRVCLLLRVLWSKPLVDVVVPVEDDVGAERVEILPEGLKGWVIEVSTRGE